MKRISLCKSIYGTIIIADIDNMRNSILLQKNENNTNNKFISNHNGWNFDCFSKIYKYEIEIDNNDWAFDGYNNILC